MYHQDGSFGQVRLAALVPTLQSEGLFFLNSIGWHKCNDRYNIVRPEGFVHHLILVTVSGCGYMRIGDTEYSLPAGSVALIPRETEHAYCTPKDGLWEFYWLHPCGAMSDAYVDALAQKGVYYERFDKSHSYAQRFERLLTLCKEHTYDTALYISKELSDVFHMVAIDLYDKPRSVSLSASVISYIEQNYQKAFKLDDLAGKLFVSTPHLIRVFKLENGYTPHQYLIKYRLLTAVQLLKFSDLRIDEIGEQVGFSSSSHFISSFKKEYGCTPMHYRTNQ